MARPYPPTGSQPPSVELTMRQGPRPGQRFSSNKPTIIIGREAGNDVVINDPQISRRHSSLTWDGRQFIIQDLGSVNGTFVNGVRLTAPRVLQGGDVIGLGPTVLLGFQALPMAAAPPPVVSPVEPPAYAPPPPAYAPRPPARRRGRFLIPLAALLGLCFVLAVAAALGYYFLWPRPDARPLVLIRSPRHGEQVEVGQEVTVHSVVRDEGKVVRVELWVDGQLQESQASTLPGGSSPFPLLARWQPSSPGTHTLIARAFNAKGVRAHASVNVEAFERMDRDGDEVADEADACPDESGSAAADGCPDGDRDGISDADDACPDEAGLPEGGGCPAPGEGNRDGDGLLDEADACPDDPGSPRADGCPDADGDGVRDSDDACPDEPGLPEDDGCPTPGDLDGDGIPAAEDDCPEEWGLPEHAGCPDDDGDGVRDVDDACLDEPGLPEHAGCPDRDHDGVPDADDLRPDDPGRPEDHGAPDTGAEDRDGDGIPDDVDLCPDEPGLPAHAGCPPPGGGEDADGDGIADDEELPAGPMPLFGLAPLWPFLPQPEPVPKSLTTIAIEVLSFAMNGDYDGVYCYVSLGGEPQTRIPPEPDYFDPAGEREWHFEFADGENHRVLVWDTDWPPLTVDMECWAYIGDDPPFSLGELHEEHPEEDWNTEITSRSTGLFAEHWFEVTYRICRPLCLGPGEEPPWDVELPQPIITHAAIGGSIGLIWQWEGDPASIEEFRVFSQCDDATGPIFRTPPDEPYIIINSLEPDCGGRCEFYVTAYGYGQESPPSNTWVWEGEECPRTVRVIFQTLETGNLGGDEREYDTVGPISGTFWVSGNTRQELDFHASVCAILSGGCPHRDIRYGFRLSHNATYQVQDIFDWVHREQASCLGRGCESNHYWAPEVNYVTVQLDDGDDLTFGATIQDVDWGSGRGSEWDTLFEGDDTLLSDEVPVPGGGGERIIRTRNIELRVWVMTLHH